MIATRTAQNGRNGHATSKHTQGPANASQRLSNQGYTTDAELGDAIIATANRIEAGAKTVADCIDAIQLSMVKGYLRDLEVAAAGSQVFDRMVDSRGTPLGSAKRWRELVTQGLAKADLGRPEWNECMQRAAALGIEVAG